MRKEDFRNQIAAASFNALRLGQDYLSNRLSTNLYYILILNEYCDGGKEGEATLYPDDERKIILCATENQVVEMLFRDGRCPQWIDIAAAGSDKKTTLLCLTCCGCFIPDEEQMHHYDRGTQPFGINPPTLPADWAEGIKFKIEKPDKAIRAIVDTRPNPLVIDRNMRDLLAERLRQYVSGQLYNVDIEWVGIRSFDEGVCAVEGADWYLYDDTTVHKAVGKRKIAGDARKMVARWICFLHTDYEYQWPQEVEIDLSCNEYWPFISQEQYETAMQNPKLLSSK